MSPLAWMGFVIAGATGAMTRYAVDRAVMEQVPGGWPWGTFVVNVTGSFLFGFVTGLGLNEGLSREPRLVLGTGFCGAYTTFSTFTYETVRLVEDGAYREAFRNAAGMFAAAVLAGTAGLALAAGFGAAVSR